MNNINENICYSARKKVYLFNLQGERKQTFVEFVSSNNYRLITNQHLISISNQMQFTMHSTCYKKRKKKV